MAFDSEKHHRRSLRLKNRDYSRNGYYFVTICARNRENLFADLCVGAGLAPAPVRPIIREKGQPRGSTNHPPTLADMVCLPPKGGLPLPKKNDPPLVLTSIGRIIENNWRKIADKYIQTDAFVIMPNHIHGIVIMKSQHLRVGAGLAPAPIRAIIREKGQPRGSTNHPPTLADMVCLPPKGGLPLQKENAPAPVLGNIIGAFKSRCAIEYLKFIDDNNLNESAKIWQRNYYEHIIRDKQELAAIRKYIKSNPANWAEDKENPLNL